MRHPRTPNIQHPDGVDRVGGWPLYLDRYTHLFGVEVGQ